jgi:hypothetical protein
MRPWRAGIAGAATPVALIAAVVAGAPSGSRPAPAPAFRTPAPPVRRPVVPNYMGNRCVEQACTARLPLSGRALAWASPEVFSPAAAFRLDVRLGRRRLELRRSGTCAYRAGGLVLTACVDADARIRLRLRVRSRTVRRARLVVRYRQLHAPAVPER